MGTDQGGRVFLALDIQPDALARFPNVSSFRIQQDLNLVLAQYFGDFFGNILILAREQLAPGLNDRHSTAKPAEELTKLQANVASAQDQQMIRNGIEFHNGNVVEERDCVQTIEFGPRRASAGIDENVFRRNCAPAAVLQANVNSLGAAESRFAEDQFEVCSLLNLRLASTSKTVDDLAFALTNFRQVNADRSSLHTVFGGPARQVRDTAAGHHSFRGSASFVHAGAADMLPLDESGTHSGTGKSGGERRTGLPRADDDGVVQLRGVHSYTSG